MLKRVSLVLMLFCLFTGVSYVCASERSASCKEITVDEAAELLKFIDVKVLSVKKSPVNGLFELLVEKNGQKGIVFLDCDRKHFMQGMIVDLKSLKPVSSHVIDVDQPNRTISLDVKKIPIEYAFIVGNKGADKNIYIFTDPDCPYCRRAHEEIQRLVKLAPDIAVYIMLYPLPMHPAAYDKSRSVFESKNADILDRAFGGKDIPVPITEGSKLAIDSIVKFANDNGITGTPTVILPSGKIEVGMPKAEVLIKMINSK